MRDALVQSPEFSRPSVGTFAPVQGREPSFPLESGGDVAGAVAALVVHQDDAEIARIILGDQTREGRRNGFGLVARGHDGGDRRP
jgi:hypothetical protein